ncbi:MAG: autotransporter outer membrane beta-barrel domain-containing protein [Verrucomicrobiales bacterium]|nr:autotransporter outer membrane beta-barrel domain-containing protein [Verrucomicrobiales bacterium]
MRSFAAIKNFQPTLTNRKNQHAPQTNTPNRGYQATRATTDGARAELGAGLIWQLDADNQLHLDYEASFGDKYDKPWGLSAGYRHQF